ncbi:trigger factor [Candidatus Uhrbacteria bacterium]|nr:trigger factor [Candidatus Uhrbacteria bacterium]
MQHTLQKLPKSTIELLIELTTAEMQPYLQKAATQLSQTNTIPGFRPGKAPYDEISRRFGIQRVWEEAAVIAVPKAFAQIIQEEKIETLGSPEVEVVKLAADNPFIFKATVALLPEITLGDYSKIVISAKEVAVPETQIDKVLADLAKMQTKEVVVDRAAGIQDKVTVDMTMSLDSVPLDGGATKDHSIYLTEEYYIPGLKEKLVGAKKGGQLEFRIKFPKTHYQKMLADKEIDFKVNVKDVFELQRPPLDDDFAHRLGKDNLADLKALIRHNLEEEARGKETERQELELLDKLVELTKFGDLPEVLINEEVLKMIGELEDGIVRQGMEFTDYLKKVGRTRDELRLDFAPPALKRVKTALAIRRIAKDHNVSVNEEEVDREVERVLEVYKDAPEQHEQIRSPGAREYLKGVLRNRKVIAWLKEQALNTNRV